MVMHCASATDLRIAAEDDLLGVVDVLCGLRDVPIDRVACRLDKITCPTCNRAIDAKLQ